MRFQIFYFLLAMVLLFQGLHLVGEIKEPLGTVPEEVSQAPEKSLGWGSFLLTYAALAIVFGLLGYQWDYFVSMRPVIFFLGCVSMAVFGAWVVFGGRWVEYIGTPSEDHGHGDHGHH
jgi:hypothetical protein